MSRGSPQLTEARKDEIINACAKLYETRGFREITLKEIGAATTLTRTGIYLYFETREEIFLALLRRSAVEDGKTVLLVTHDGEALPYGTRIYRMESGNLKTDGY